MSEKTWGEAEEQKIRGLIQHESAMVNNRLTWLTTLNGFLFAALAFAWSDAQSIIPLFAVFGFLLSISVFLSVQRAVAATERYVDAWDKHRDPNHISVDVTGHRPVRGLKKVVRFLMPWYFIPLSLAVFWIIIFGVARSSEKDKGEQDGAHQPATAVDSKSEGNENANPESKARSR